MFLFSGTTSNQEPVRQIIKFVTEPDILKAVVRKTTLNLSFYEKKEAVHLRDSLPKGSTGN
jgi:hypothetical protein